MYPDFLGIGAQKAGTTWLARNLARHPDIWMPPLKEIHYFDRPDDWRDPVKLRVSDAPDLPEDLAWMQKYDRMPRNDKWYAALFEDGKGLVRGEFTPAYAILEQAGVSRVHRLMPDAKLLFFIRNPIERVWSQSLMYFERQGRDATRVTLRELRDHARLERVRSRTRYLRTLKAWRRFYPDDRIFLGFAEDISFRPSELLSAVYKFLGVDPDFRPTGFDKRVHSRSSGVMPARFAQLLARHYLRDMGRLSDEIGGYTDFWLHSANKLLDSDYGKTATVTYPFFDSTGWMDWIGRQSVEGDSLQVTSRSRTLSKFDDL